MGKRLVLAVMTSALLLAPASLPVLALSPNADDPGAGYPHHARFALQPEDYNSTVTYMDKKHRRAAVSITLNQGTGTENTLAISDPQLGQISCHADGRNATVGPRRSTQEMKAGFADDRTCDIKVNSIRKDRPQAKAFITFTFINGFLDNWGSVKVLLP